MQLNSSSSSPAGLGAAPRAPRPPAEGGPWTGLDALQSLAGRVGLRAAAMGARTKSCPKPTLFSHEARALPVQIFPLFVRNAIPTLFVRD